MSAPPAPPPPPRLPKLKAIKCIVKQRCVWCANGHVYKITRTLRECIYGEVAHAVVCAKNDADGRFYPTTQQVALKMMSKVGTKSHRLGGRVVVVSWGVGCGVTCIHLTLVTPQGRINARHAAAVREGKAFENPLSELATLQMLSEPGHPNLINVIETVHSDDQLIAVLEFANGGELYDVITEAAGHKFDTSHAQRLFRQVMEVVAYIHGKGIAHRDLSLENLMLGDGDNIKVIDFGLAVALPMDGTGAVQALPACGPTGKVSYMAPEVSNRRVVSACCSLVAGCATAHDVMRLALAEACVWLVYAVHHQSALLGQLE